MGIRGLTALAFTTALAVCPFLAAASETEVSFEVAGQTVRGTLETPPGPAAPVVLLLHGGGGTRDELAVAGTDEGVFSRTARVLAEHGYASLRIDFRGFGDSDGQRVDLTITGQIDDAVAAIDWLASNSAVAGDRIAVLGWSQGAFVGAHAATERPSIETLILWAPLVNLLATAYHLFGVKPINSDLNSNARKAAFAKDGVTYAAAGAVAHYPGPMKVIACRHDEAIQPQPAMSEVLIRYHGGTHSLSVFDTDHVFGAKQGPEIIDTQMIPTTLAWLGEHFSLDSKTAKPRAEH